MIQMAPLNESEAAIVSAIAHTMIGAQKLATIRDQLVAEGGHTRDSARDYLAEKFGAADKPVGPLIDWWDHECSYSTPAFAQIMEAMNVAPVTREFILRCGAQADSAMAKMLAAVRTVH